MESSGGSTHKTQHSYLEKALSRKVVRGFIAFNLAHASTVRCCSLPPGTTAAGYAL